MNWRRSPIPYGHACCTDRYRVIARRLENHRRPAFTAARTPASALNFSLASIRHFGKRDEGKLHMDVLSDASRSTQLSHAFGRLRTMALAACLAMAFPPTNLRAEIDADPATVARRIQLEPVLTAELQRVVNAQKRIEGQGKDVTVKARFETLTGGGVDLVIDLSESYVPGVFGSEMEDLQRELHTTAAELLRDIVSFRGVTFRYGGKHVHHYFPEQRLQEMRAAEGRKNAAKRASVPMVVVAAGHGIYYNHGSRIGALIAIQATESRRTSSLLAMPVSF
jgi:hypothetical protein